MEDSNGVSDMGEFAQRVYLNFLDHMVGTQL